MSENEIARAAAQQLAAEMPEGFPEMVEAVLAVPDRKPDQYLDPVTVSLAAVLVSVASLGWTIYKDMKTAKKAAAGDALARTIRIELVTPNDVSQDQRDRIIAVVANEILRK